MQSREGKKPRESRAGTLIYKREIVKRQAQEVDVKTY